MCRKSLFTQAVQNMGITSYIYMYSSHVSDTAEKWSGESCVCVFEMFLFTEYANHFHDRNWHSVITAVLGDCRRTKSPGRATKSYDGASCHVTFDDNVTKLGVRWRCYRMSCYKWEFYDGKLKIRCHMLNQAQDIIRDKAMWQNHEGRSHETLAIYNIYLIKWHKQLQCSLACVSQATLDHHGLTK